MCEINTKWGLADLCEGEENLRVVKFPSSAEADKAIDMMWNEPELVDKDFDTRDNTTLIVPQESVAILRAKGLIFEESKLV